MATVTFTAEACDEEHVRVEFKQDGRVTKLVFEKPDEAYHFAQAILRAYDDAVGITPPGEQ